MASLDLTAPLIIAILYTCECATSVYKYDRKINSVPSGTAYESLRTRSRLDCATFCSGDPECSTFTVKAIGSEVECELYICLETMHSSTQAGVQSFTKRGKRATE